MDLPESKYVTKKQAEEIFNLGPKNLYRWTTRPNKAGIKVEKNLDDTYDLVQIADYLLSRSRSGVKNVEDLIQKSLDIKKFYGAVTSKDKKRLPKSEEKILPTEEGIEFALKRVQATEAELARKVEEELNDPAALGNAINNWSKLLEILRKTEVDCLKVLEEKKQLIRFDVAADAYEKGILPVKQRLLSLPVNLATLLENQEAPMIQKILEKEIDKVLKDIGNIWDDEDDSN